VRPDSGDSTPLELCDIDTEESLNVEKLLESFWTEAGFDIERAWGVIDAGNRGTVSLEEFEQGTRNLGFTGDARLIFRGLDVEGFGRLKKGSFEYLLTLSQASTRSQRGASNFKEFAQWTTDIGGPEVLLRKLGYTAGYTSALGAGAGGGGASRSPSPNRQPGPTPPSPDRAVFSPEPRHVPSAGHVLTVSELAAYLTALGYPGDANEVACVLSGPSSSQVNGKQLQQQLTGKVSDRNLKALKAWAQRDLGGVESLLSRLGQCASPTGKRRRAAATGNEFGGAPVTDLSLSPLSGQKLLSARELAARLAALGFPGNTDDVAAVADSDGTSYVNAASLRHMFERQSGAFVVRALNAWANEHFGGHDALLAKLGLVGEELPASRQTQTGVEKLTIGNFAARLTAIGYPGNSMQVAAGLSKLSSGGYVFRRTILESLDAFADKHVGGQAGLRRALTDGLDTTKSGWKDHVYSTNAGKFPGTAKQQPAGVAPPPGGYVGLFARSMPCLHGGGRAKPEWDSSLYISTEKNVQRSVASRTYFSDPSEKPVRQEIRQKLAARSMTRTSMLHTFR